MLIIVLSIVLDSLTIDNRHKSDMYFRTNQVSKTNDSLIVWNSNYKLTWNDFKGIADSLSNYKALTYSTIEINSIIIKEDLLEYEIKCSFEKHLSWSKNKQSLSLLRHEQLHFDISELITRNLRKKFSAHISTDIQTTREIKKRLFNEAIEERRLLNNRYDNETDHSIIIAKQKEWETKIATELKKLDKYASTRVVLKRVKR